MDGLTVANIAGTVVVTAAWLVGAVLTFRIRRRYTSIFLLVPVSMLGNAALAGSNWLIFIVIERHATTSGWTIATVYAVAGLIMSLAFAAAVATLIAGIVCAHPRFDTGIDDNEPID